MSLISPTPSLNGIITKKLQTYTTSINNEPHTGEEEKGSLFKPLKIGDFELDHRIVMCPLTRHRADKDGVHSELAQEYYEQRASEGGLIITEGTLIAEEAGGEAFVPGIYSDPQIKAWKKITDRVHEKGGKIFCQLWALGRIADPSLVSHFYAPSDIPNEGSKVPKGGLSVMTQEDINLFINHYQQAAVNAINQGGFDGLEIHAANGYLIDQFLQTTCNARLDAYGGSPPNRLHFFMQIISAISSVIPTHKIGIRISPFSTFQSMRMPHPLETFIPLLEQVLGKFPELGYVHVIEGEDGDSTLPLREIVDQRGNGTVFISSGNYTPQKAREVVGELGGMVGFGRYFISNPDLPFRIQHSLPLNRWDEGTFYTQGAEGYIDYPTWEEESNNQQISAR